MRGTLDIVGGRLIDGIADQPRSNGSLRVQDGRIVALWEGSAAPAEANGPADRVLDARGKTVMPGLIDAHCHISYGEGRSAEEVDVYGGAEWAAVRAVWNCGKVLRAGVTSFCDPGSTWLVAVTARDAIASGMFPGPRIFAAGRHIAADGGFADYFPSWLGMPASAEGVLCHTREEMVREVRQQAKNRVDLVKISGDSQAQERLDNAGPCLSDEEMQAIVSTAHALGRKTAIHARYANTVVAAVRAGIDWLIHASYMRSEDIGFVRDNATPICPTFTFTANIVEWGRDVGVDPNYIEVKKRELDALASIHRRALRVRDHDARRLGGGLFGDPLRGLAHARARAARRPGRHEPDGGDQGGDQQQRGGIRLDRRCGDPAARRTRRYPGRRWRSAGRHRHSRRHEEAIEHPARRG